MLYNEENIKSSAGRFTDRLREPSSMACWIQIVKALDLLYLKIY